MFLYMYWYGYIIIIPGILFALWAQIRVSTTFAKYDKVQSRSNWTASDLSRMLLEKNGCAVVVQPTKGKLTDNYNPKTGVLSLSEATYNSSSVAALGVAAHEVGHAVQHEEGYFLLKLRSFIVPAVNFATYLAIPLVIIGVLLEWLVVAAPTVGSVFISLGIICYSLATVFSLITLPVELNASRRAKKMLLETGVLEEDEVKQVGKVLNAAAMTYFAGLLVSLLYFLRFLLIVGQFRRRD